MDGKMTPARGATLLQPHCAIAGPSVPGGVIGLA